MSRLIRFASILLVFAAISSCKESNPQYCDGHPDDLGRCPPPDAGVCTADEQCDGMVCDTASGACVECTADKSAACTGATPVCGSEQMCQPCTAHAQCADSNVCLPSGACGTASEVAYVSASGSGTACTQASPCRLLKDALARGLAYVKVAADGAGNDTNPIVIDGQAVTILAEPGATIDRDGDGPILEVKSANADVAIYDLSITGASSASGVGILVTPNGGDPQLSLTRAKVDSNQGGGISSSGGSVTVTQSTVSSNQGGGISVSGGSVTVTQSTVSSNQGGGISVSGPGTMFAITNNVVVYNGTANGATASQLGGVALTSNTGGATFEFNTVAFNQCDGSIYRGGATCTGAMVAAAGNIVYRNGEADGSGGIKVDSTTQRNATGCQFGTTLAIAMDASNLGFESPATAPYDFHLTASTPSTVVGAGGACTGVDLDGDTRPQGGACDLGADEYTP